MAITASAKKAHRQNKKRAVVNEKRKNNMKRAVKTVTVATAAKDKKTSEMSLSPAFQALDKAAKRGVIKKGTADRKKSRLARAIAKI